MLQIDVVADSFLRRMVRNLVGTLVAVGSGSMSLEQLTAAMARKNRNSNPGICAPASGLYLTNVYYDVRSSVFVDRNLAMDNSSIRMPIEWMAKLPDYPDFV